MRLRTIAVRLSLTAAVAWAVLLAVAAGNAADNKDVAKANPATTPSPRKNKEGKEDVNWMKRHEGFVAIAKKGGVNVLFLGDSITDAWRGKNGKATWDKYFKPLGAANFGISGDRTEHVLWRIQNGELEGITPRAIVLMIGTNNSNANSAQQIAAGITAIVKTLREKSPASQILLLGVFPRDQGPSDARRKKLTEVNQMVSKLDDGKHVHYLDIGAKFLQPDGTLTRDIMPDLLHPNARGYEIWGEAIAPSVDKMVGKKAAT